MAGDNVRRGQNGFFEESRRTNERSHVAALLFGGACTQPGPARFKAKGKGVASQHLIALKNPLFLKMAEDG